MIATNIQPRSGLIYSFEVAHNVYTQSLSHTKDIHNLTIYPRSPLDSNIEALIPQKLDFVFIDGQKAQYDQYLMKIRPLLHKESVVLCDDVIKFQNKLIALYRYLEKMQIFYHTMQIERDDGVMLI
jgi:predicted O-methyltransferase YrrM